MPTLEKSNDNIVSFPTKLEYHADTPDVLVTFGIWVYRDKAIIRAREHRERRWLEQWEVPYNAAYGI